eukprot:2483120-Pleurochrysis_carterae.AAC.1
MGCCCHIQTDDADGEALCTIADSCSWYHHAHCAGRQQLYCCTGATRRERRPRRTRRASQHARLQRSLGCATAACIHSPSS